MNMTDLRLFLERSERSWHTTYSTNQTSWEFPLWIYFRGYVQWPFLSEGGRRFCFLYGEICPVRESYLCTEWGGGSVWWGMDCWYRSPCMVKSVLSLGECLCRYPSVRWTDTCEIIAFPVSFGCGKLNIIVSQNFIIPKKGFRKVFRSSFSTI